MKKVLITGAHSYIGTSFEKYITQWPEDYQVDTVDLVDGAWRERYFAGYDCVFHVAGIVHVKETAWNADLYQRVNCDLALETAEKARNEGVGQFIFLSSMSVYGIEEGIINRQTPTGPRSHYGKSKLKAEEGLNKLRSDAFHVAVMRPPMVYGEGCKGNYQILVKFAKYVPFFPDYRNQRSALHIDMLVRFVKKLIDDRADGLYLPQDPEYMCTCETIRKIGAEMGRNIPLVKIFNPAVSLVRYCSAIGRKAFGSLYYERSPEDSLGE